MNTIKNLDKIKIFCYNKSNCEGRSERVMKTFEIKTLPRVIFAHTYHAERYSNTFGIKETRMEVTYISEGSLQITRNGKEYRAQQGDLICLPYSPHEIKVNASEYHEHHTVQAELTWEEDGVNGLYLPIVTPTQLHTKNARMLIDQLICNPLLFKDSSTKGATLFLSLLYEIDKCNRSTEKETLPSDVRYTMRAKEYVQQNLRLPITQKSVAEHLSITPEYLCSVFKRVEGITLIKYVNTEKLSAIRTLMEKEHVHLYEATAMFGYNDPNYVSRLFKQYYRYNITNQPNHLPEIAP